MHHRIKGDSADGVALKYCTTVQEREILPPPLTPAHIPLLTCPESLAPPMFNSQLATIEPYTRKLLQRVLSSGESNVRRGSVTFHSALIAGVDFTACDVQWRTHSISTFTPTRFLPFLRQETQNTCDEHVQKRPKGTSNCLRPYHAESTGSRPITEVKQRRARLVLGWVTAWEYRVP